MVSFLEIKKIIIMVLIMLTLDSLYFFVMGRTFTNMIMSIQRVAMIFRPLGAVLCYILLSIALYYFIIRRNKSPEEAFLLGVIIYGVYDTTNYATLKKWNPVFAAIDTLWGGILFASTTIITAKFLKGT